MDMKEMSDGVGDCNGCWRMLNGDGDRDRDKEFMLYRRC